MEWIKRMHLKKALFVIAFFNSMGALILSVLSFWGCMELRTAIVPQGVALKVGQDSVTRFKVPQITQAAENIAELLSVLQLVLPIFFYTCAMLFTASMFYHIKLKKPLETLTEGASRIIKNDLDFTMEAVTKDSLDELERLCSAFETMRRALLENNRELWRHAEERKRLNAAFSHNLRNPITVLKGSVKLARTAAGTEQMDSHLSRMESYTHRIERYVETMSSIQKLEELPVERTAVQWDPLMGELKSMIDFAGADSGIQIRFYADETDGMIWIDSSVLFQIAENLVLNAMRFAVRHVEVSCRTDGHVLELTVMDDGCGFSAAILKNGIRPFQKGNEDAGHFGMGLYACSLLCQRHGGAVTISNNENGAVVAAVLKIQKP